MRPVLTFLAIVALFWYLGIQATRIGQQGIWAWMGVKVPQEFSSR